MSKSPLRKDKTCLNCNYVVENRFCPNCGQENTDTRKTFHHLFIHFFEDLTHYENAFWKTIKNLYFKPGLLTKEYLSGKRLSYLSPIKLYIFISFVTFFFITVFSENTEKLQVVNQMQNVQVKDKKGVLKDSLISVEKINLSELLKAGDTLQKDQYLTNEKANDDFLNFGYKNIRELDSMQKYGPADKKLENWEYNLIKKSLLVKEKNTNQDIREKFLEQLWHNFPKTLFIYMPLFAFVLWLFHGKKHWYYFDHGIFTLHYFSFLLLSILLIFFFNKVLDFFVENSFINTLRYIGSGICFVWMFYYFFPAHHLFYGETRSTSFIKSIVMFVINAIMMSILLLMFMFYTFINLH